MNKMIFTAALFSIIAFSFCHTSSQESDKKPFIVVLGTAQDGGYPHTACKKECCRQFYEGKEMRHYVSSLAIIDPVSKERFLFDCTPDFPAQLHLLDSISPAEKIMDGIFLTHAHIGHYTGLMFLGRETMNSKNVNVYVMPEMNVFLQNNGPWSLLVQLQNINLIPMMTDSVIRLNERISVIPFLVPHRHEYTETVGYKIFTSQKSVIFIPDIDKWSTWNRDIIQLVKENDLLFLDGTFFRNGEIAGRDMSEIPHPFIEESMKLFEHLPVSEKSKIHFIHLNHSNPALIRGSESQHEIEQHGFQIAHDGQLFSL